MMKMKSVKLSDGEYKKLLEAQKYLEEKQGLKLSLGGTIGIMATSYLRLVDRITALEKSTKTILQRATPAYLA